jgi:hypothetical protein
MPSTPRGRPTRDAAPPTDEQLVAWFEAGELLDHIVRYFDLADYTQFRAIGRRAGAMAGNQKLDLLSLIENGDVGAVGGHGFFNVQQFFNEAIPSLDIPVPRMLAAVDTLVRLGGGDLAANQPNAALREWLRKDLARAEAVIVAADADDNQAKAQLVFALEAIGDPDRVRRFLEREDPLLKASALSALARMADPDLESRTASVVAIGNALGTGENDMLCANGVEALMSVASPEPAVPNEVVLAALMPALSGRGDSTLNRTAHVLWAHKAAQRPDIATVLLQALLELNPEHKGTTNELDLGLKAVIDAGQDAAALQFLADLLVKNQGTLKAAAFNSVWDAILSGRSENLSAWIVDWLLAGKPALGFALTEVLRRQERDEVTLEVDRPGLPATAPELGYLARKAVGWFMMQPRLATGLLVAILGVCDQATARNVAGLLAHPILRNYPEMREALSQLPKDDPAKPWVDAALAENERYLNALKAMPDIPELTPADQHRRIQHLHHVDQMQAAHKAARAQSVFFNLVHHSTMLYGIRSLIYVEDLDGGPRRPMEMELGTHSVTMTLPRLDMLDPIGLQLMLVRFRGEARPQ